MSISYARADALKRFMWLSRRKTAGPSGVGYARIPSKTPVPYWSACALTCTCAESHGVSSPFIQMNSVFVNGGMASPRRKAFVDPEEYAAPDSATASTTARRTTGAFTDGDKDSPP